MEHIFIQLAIILFMAFVISYTLQKFKQPIIIGYIITGILAAIILEFGFIKIDESKEIIEVFSHFGIAFLLFIVGLHLNPKKIKEVGTSSLLVGLAQIALTFAFSFLVSFKLLGFDIITSFYIGIALSFSSTIIIMKLLSDRKQIDSLYGKISIGILIVQDFVAVFVLMFISSFSGNINFSSFAVSGLIYGTLLIIVLFLMGFSILPKLIKSTSHSQELLFLFSITWCFVISALFSIIGFSIEIGALIAGIVLSISPYSTEISSKIRPLRDFFLIIFFVILGLNIQIMNIGSIIINALILSSIALIFKPLILIISMAISGYTKRNNFLVGTTLGQISEVSFHILAVGVIMNHIAPEILSTITLTGVITIFLSTYMIIYSNNLYKKLSKILSIFERKNIKRERRIRKKYHAILFGYNRIGFSILNSLKRIKKSYLVVDFNPDIIADLKKFRIPCIYGDSFDPELLEELPLDQINLAISTIPDFDTNLLLIDSIKKVNPGAIIIVRAHRIKDALDLYEKGADYVLTPHFLGGEYIAKMIREIKTIEEDYQKEKQKHIKTLKEMLEKGHKHPEIERN
jgi:Kef-type K+ transport system membrane component KefB/voltage-gated potassium channel Kch